MPKKLSSRVREAAGKTTQGLSGKSKPNGSANPSDSHNQDGSGSAAQRVGAPSAIGTQQPKDAGDWWLLTDAVLQLRDVVEQISFPLPTADADQAREQCQALLRQLDDYVIPRLKALDAPLLAVIGGSTGAGKSTLVNSLVGRTLTQPGVLRPTTRSPVLVFAPEDVAWFGDQRILPELARTNASSADPHSVQLIPERNLTSGLALLDAPDVDSVVASNRDLAQQLLAAADLWIFLTTAARYADAVPWQVLATASTRNAAVALVLDRIAPDAVPEVSEHLRSMMAAHGLAGAPLFIIEESALADGLLPEQAITALRTWLWDLAADAASRSAVVRQTLDGTLDSLHHRVDQLAEHLQHQHEVAEHLRQGAAQSYEQALRAIDQSVRNGTLLRGEVLARWQELVGSPQFLRNLQTRLGRVRDSIAAWLNNADREHEHRLGQALESGVQSIIANNADKAAQDTVRRWKSDAAGAVLISQAGGQALLDRRSPGFDAAAQQLVRDWQGAVLALVRREAAGKRSSARLLSYGINGAGLVVMVAVFASTAGLTGAEIAVAGGTSVVAQKLLEALLGDQAVRELAAKARHDLHARIQELFASQRQRFDDLVATGAGEPHALLSAVKAMENAR